jgi:competence protein ComEC
MAAGAITALALALWASQRIALARTTLAVALGIAAVAGRCALASGSPAPAAALPSGDGPWVAVVQGVGSPRAGSRPAVVQLATEPPASVAATLPWYPVVVPGDRIELRGRIRAPPPDDYGAYLARIGAIGTLRADGLRVLPPLDSIQATLEGLRRTAAAGLDRAMPEPESGLAAGVLIGLRDRVDRDLAADFTTAGASHVVAISGWNIAIVASTLGAIAGGLRRRRRAALTALAIVLYVAFVGPSPSVVRAGVMAGVALLARELGRPGTAAIALGWAVTALLLLDPGYIDDAGFRLSVLATAGILAWGSSLTARLAGPAPGRPRRWLADILGVSLAAQLATTPIVLLDFGRVSLVAPAVNLIVVPLVPPAMAAGALALGVGVLAGLGVPAIMATLVGLPAWAMYAAMVATVRAGAGLPLASLQLVPPWDLMAAMMSLVAILAFARWGDRALDAARRVGRSPSGHRPAQRVVTGTAGGLRREEAHGASRAARLAAVILAGSTIALAVVLVHRSDALVHVTILDVGQGDGILVEGERGGRLVIDGGPDPARLLVALDERLPPWDRRIDILILTHPHEDHVAGLPAILARYRVGRVYEPGMRGPGPGYQAWVAAFAQGGPPRGRLSTGDRLRLDGIAFHVLWPDANRVPDLPADGGTAINNVSIVLLGDVGQQRFLLAGDIEEGVDPVLLQRGLPRVDLLKVAHHGSRTSSTSAFLAAVQPTVAVVSAGAGNPYGHPAPATIDRLHAAARSTYRTDTDGTVEVTFDGASLRVKMSGRRRTSAVEPASGRAVVAARPAVAGATSFLCSVLADASTAPGAGVLPPVPEAPLSPRVILGLVDARRAGVEGMPSLPRLPPPVTGKRMDLVYHRTDAGLQGAGNLVAGNRSPRLLLGRRRVRPRCGSRGIPERRRPLPGWGTRTLATGGRAHRTRPPPRRAPRAAGDRRDVRRWQPRHRAGCGRAGPEQ